MSLLPLLFASAVLSAEPVAETLPQKFQRAVRLFEAGDPNAALREFEAIQRAKASPAVLFNIAFCRSKLEDPVGATAAVDELLLSPGSLDAGRLTMAKQLRDSESTRVAPLELALPADAPEPISVEVDGVTHLIRRGEVVKLNPGRHSVTVLAPGTLPWRQLVDASAGQPVRETVELVKSERKPAQLRIESKLSQVRVELDGKPVGETPIHTALPMAPGEHELSFSRDGYLRRVEPVTLAEGARETLKADLEADPNALRSTLSLHASETGVVVTVDAETFGDRPTLSLPQGPHLVRLERDGYFPAERQVRLEPGATLELPVTLEPTPGTLSLLEQNAARHRFWGWLGVGVGGAALIAGLITFGVNFPNLEQTYRDTDANQAACLMGTMSSMACVKARELGAQATLQEQYQTAALIIAGVGAAAIGAGLLALFTAPDLERYHHGAPDSLAPLTLELRLGPGAVSLAGAF